MSKVVRELAAVYGAKVRPMNVDEYYLAADKGVFGPDERLELINGQVLQMSPERSPHAFMTENCADPLRSLFPNGWVRTQHPLRLDPLNEPEPDVLVVKLPKNQYRNRHPDASDVLLLVEVSDTSLKKDRQLKMSLYAEFEIPEYWILDLKKLRVEVHREPQEGRYKVTEIISKDGSVTPLSGSGSVSVADLLPD